MENVISKKIITTWIMLLLYCAAAHGEYEITWYTIDGGGGASSGPTYEVIGTIGQHDASLTMEGQDYTTSGGFWAGSYECIVNLIDLQLFAEQWLMSGTDIAADLDGSETVDYADFSDIVYYWLDHCPAGWPLK